MMKVITDPETGVTTCELEKPDRNKLAAAATVCEQLAFHLRGTLWGDTARKLTNDLAALLAPVEPNRPSQPKPAAEAPKPPAKTASTPPAK